MFLVHICGACKFEEFATEITPQKKCPKCGLLTEDRWVDEENEMEI